MYTPRTCRLSGLTLKRRSNSASAEPEIPVKASSAVTENGIDERDCQRKLKRLCSVRSSGRDKPLRMNGSESGKSARTRNSHVAISDAAQHRAGAVGADRNVSAAAQRARWADRFNR